MTVVRPTGRQRWADLALALCCVTVTVLIQAGRIDSVPANRPPDALSIALTVAAVLPIAWRRVAPLAMLAACFPGFLALIAVGYSVGAAPIGVLIAFYSVTAWDTRRNSRIAVVVVIVGYGIAALLHPVDLSLEGALFQAATVVGGWIIGTGTRDRRDLHAAQMAAAAQQVAHATTEERLRITRELHDVLGHAFSVMVVQAGVAQHLLDTQPDEARRALTEIDTIGRTSLADMRRMLHVLRDGSTELPRDPAPTLDDVPALIAGVQAAGLPVRLEVRGTVVPLSPGVGLAAYRVIQEALTNCLKHSGASQASVFLTYGEGTVAVEVRDNGTVAAPLVSSQGHGLAGMRERVAMYDGSLSAGSTVEGYVVSATLQLGTA